MSLLNDMLKDIEKNKAAQGQEKIVIPRLNTSNWSRQARSYFRVIALSVIMANVMIGSAIWLAKHRAIMPEKKLSAKTVRVKSSQPLRVVRQSRLPMIANLSAKKALLAEAKKPISSEKITVDTIKKESKPTKRQVSLAQYQDAMNALKRGETEKGTLILNTLVQSDKLFFDAWNSLIILDMDANKSKQALVKVEQAMKLFPSSLVLVQHKARLLMQQGDYKNSIAELLSRRPNIEEAPDYYALLAALYEKTRETFKAGQIYQSLVQLYPDNANYWLGLALSLEHAAHMNQALSAYHKVLENYGSSPVITAFARERILQLRG